MKEDKIIGENQPDYFTGKYFKRGLSYVGKEPILLYPNTTPMRLKILVRCYLLE